MNPPGPRTGCHLVPLGLVAAWSLGATPAAAPEVVALLDVNLSGGVSAELTTQTTRLLAVALQQAGGYEVLSGEAEIRARLRQRNVNDDPGACREDTSCTARVLRALGGRWLVTAGLARIGDTYILNAKIIDIPTVSVAKRATATLPARPDALPELVRRLAAALLAEQILTSGRCAFTAECLTHGLCSNGTTGCAAATDADCRAGDNCGKLGLCTAEDGRCVVTEQSCRQSAVCRTEGRCTVDGDRCGRRR